MRRYPSQDTREAWARAEPKVQDKDGWTPWGLRQGQRSHRTATHLVTLHRTNTMWEKKKAPEPPLASTLGTPSDLPTEAVPSQPVATSSGVSNAAGGPGGGQSWAQIGKSLKLKGEITGSEDLYIDGEVEGTVELKGNSLTVGPNGKVHADVSARSVTILGRLQGNVKVGERTEIRKTGSFGGDLLTAQIVIEDGAVFRGSIDIVKPGQNAANTPAADGPARTARKQKGPGTPRTVASAPNLGASTAPKP